MTLANARIGQIAVNVKDIDRAVAFYRDTLGLRFLFAAPPKMGFFDCAGVRLMLGVPDRNLFFLGYPDQEAYKYLEAALADVEKLVQRLSPIEFTAHAYEGGNIDHDAVAFIAALAARRFDVPLFEFPDSNMYQGRARVWTFLPRDDTPTLYTRLDKKLYGLRMRVQHSYPNQAASLSFYDFAMDKKSFIKNGEPYRAAPAYDFTKPPAPEVRYSITSQGLVTVDMWIEAARAFL